MTTCNWIIKIYKQNYNYDEIINNYFCSDDYRYHPRMVNLLLNRNMVSNNEKWINNQNDKGRTILHIASILKDENNIKKILKNKGNMFLKDHYNKKAIEYLVINEIPAYGPIGVCKKPWCCPYPLLNNNIINNFNNHKQKMIYKYVNNKWNSLILTNANKKRKITIM